MNSKKRNRDLYRFMLKTVTEHVWFCPLESSSVLTAEQTMDGRKRLLCCSDRITVWVYLTETVTSVLAVLKAVSWEAHSNKSNSQKPGSSDLLSGCRESDEAWIGLTSHPLWLLLGPEFLIRNLSSENWNLHFLSCFHLKSRTTSAANVMSERKISVRYLNKWTPVGIRELSFKTIISQTLLDYFLKFFIEKCNVLV